MRLRSGLLFWGVFLIVLGAVPLAVQNGWLDRDAVIGLWRLWPLALIALGVAVMLSRTPVAVIGAVAAAVVLGVAAGGALAAGWGWMGHFGADCGGEGPRPGAEIREQGSFADSASVDLNFNCGLLVVDSAPGSDWSLTAAHQGPAPTISASDAELRVRSRSDGPFWGGHRQEWELSLPTDATLTLRTSINAGEGRLDLTDATLERLSVDTNAGQTAVDLADVTELRLLDLSVNAGSSSINLGAGSLEGSLSVNAGSIDLCVPDEVALAITLDANITFGHNLDDRGLTERDSTWFTTDYETAAQQVDLAVAGNAASFTLNPEGGCR
jgi:hypothetical protein